jgi:hypothetical protein
MGGQQVGFPGWRRRFGLLTWTTKAYYWPVMYPDFVERKVQVREHQTAGIILPSLDMSASAARLAPVPTISGECKMHFLTKSILIYEMQSFLEGPKAALVASKDFDNGHYQKTPQYGLRAFGRVYSAWAYGQTVCAGYSSPFQSH